MVLVKEYGFDPEIYQTVARYGKKILASREMKQNRKLPMHGNVSIYEHCFSVAYVALILSRKKEHKKPISEKELIYGALLHDFFLYDWHRHDSWHRLHGYRHPRFACQNASARFVLTAKEKDIILHHMFPLTIIPPFSREGWYVCLADKYCARYEHKYRRPVIDLKRVLFEEEKERKNSLNKKTFLRPELRSV